MKKAYIIISPMEIKYCNKKDLEEKIKTLNYRFWEIGTNIIRVEKYPPIEIRMSDNQDCRTV